MKLSYTQVEIKSKRPEVGVEVKREEKDEEVEEEANGVPIKMSNGWQIAEEHKLNV